MRMIMGIVLMIVALLCVLPLAGCAHGSSATIMDSIARIAEANAIYGKKTDVNVQVHTPVANVSIVVETEFRDESETTPVE